MSEITAEMVRELREATNVSMMECKRALVEAGGDKAKAVKVLRERGMAFAAKKAGRTANQGLIVSVVKDGKVGALVEVDCETDFVARNESFQDFAKTVAERALTTDDNLANLFKDQVTARIAEIGENIVIRRHVRFQLQGKGLIATYVHPGSKIGVLLEVGCEKDETAAGDAFKELVKDLSLHIAASSPRYLERRDVPADVVASEREIYAKQVTNKPPQIIEKIVDGKMGKFYQLTCMVEQGFVKTPDQPVSRVVEAKAKELGDKLVIRRFVRYQLGD